MSQSRSASALVCALAGLPLGVPTLAKEESKIQLELDGTAAYRAVGPCWLQSCAAVCRCSQSNRRNLSSFLGISTTF